MSINTQNNIPYTIKDTDKLKRALDLPFEPPHGMLIEKKGKKDSCVVKFVPPMSELGMSISDECLKQLFLDDIIELKK
jgi:hypothetical protein